MNKRTAFATLKMNMFMTMTFSLGTLIYKSIIYRRLVLCKKTFFRKPVQIAVHSRLIHLKPVFLQKIRKFGCRKNSFKASFNESRNEFRCLSVIRFLQHGCILCTIDKIVKRNEFIFLPGLSFSTQLASKMNHEKFLVQKSINFSAFHLCILHRRLQNRLFCKT